MGALGLEPRTYALKGRCLNDVSAVNKRLTGVEQADFAIYLANLLQKHPALEQVIPVWPDLPEHIKQAITTLAQAQIKESKE